MAYTALYRKWRPTVFDDVKGQDPIVAALRNQIRTGRTGHAYLFCGTRGTGKTTIAKIFARAVNCENPKDGNPCNECASCRAALDGSSVNVLEIDAASNNGVDNIREIREEVRYAPTEGRKKVYIIDEVHMLSSGAFNALLKTLEEPPEHVMFILATTEAYKIPITVLSRCQRYDFRRISVDVIADRLRQLTDGEGVGIEDRALRYVARKADGSLRDSISLLDQCIAFHFDEALTYDMVLDVLGATSNELFGALLRSVIEGRTADCLGLIDEIVMQGRELSQLVTDFIWYLRNIMLLKASDLDADTLEVSEEDLMDLAEMSNRISEPVIMRYIRVFSELSGRIRYAQDKRVQLEMAFLKLMHPESEYNLDSVLNRLEILENKLKQGYIPAQGGYPGGNGYQGSSGYPGNGGYPGNNGYPENSGYPDDQGYYPDMDYPGMDYPDPYADLNGQAPDSYRPGNPNPNNFNPNSFNPGYAGPNGFNPGNAGPDNRGPFGNPAAESTVVRIPKSQMEQYKMIQDKWLTIVNALDSQTLSIALNPNNSMVEPGSADGVFVIIFKNAKANLLGNRQPYQVKISEAIREVTGIECRIEMKDGSGGAQEKHFEAEEDEIQSMFQGIEVETED